MRTKRKLEPREMHLQGNAILGREKSATSGSPTVLTSRSSTVFFFSLFFVAESPELLRILTKKRIQKKRYHLKKTLTHKDVTLRVWFS